MTASIFASEVAVDLWLAMNASTTARCVAPARVEFHASLTSGHQHPIYIAPYLRRQESTGDSGRVGLSERRPATTPASHQALSSEPLQDGTGYVRIVLPILCKAVSLRGVPHAKTMPTGRILKVGRI